MKVRVGIINNSAVDVWRFEVNKVGYVDLFVNQMYMDTVYDIGIISNIAQLEGIVRELLKCWEVNHKDLYLDC